MCILLLLITQLYVCLLTNCNYCLTTYFLLKTIDDFLSQVILSYNRALRFGVDKSM